MYRAKENTRHHRFVGISPYPGDGGRVIDVLVGEMNAEQMEWWLRVDPVTARQYIEGPAPQRVTPARDNDPGAPWPTPPEAEKSPAEAKKTTKTRKRKKKSE